jgi:hypothetical protein
LTSIAWPLLKPFRVRRGGPAEAADLSNEPSTFEVDNEILGIVSIFSDRVDPDWNPFTLRAAALNQRSSREFHVDGVKERAWRAAREARAAPAKCPVPLIVEVAQVCAPTGPHGRMPPVRKDANIPPTRWSRVLNDDGLIVILFTGRSYRHGNVDQLAPGMR